MAHHHWVYGRRLGRAVAGRAGVGGLHRGLFVGAMALSLAVGGCDCSADLGSGGGGSRCTSTSDCRIGTCVDGHCVAPGADAGPPFCATDGDGDGYGPGCRLGPDCDDTDPRQTGVEVCDGHDNDCDGVADNGVLSSCGDCDPTCLSDGIGSGTGTAFDPDMDESESVGIDPVDGALILDSRRVETNFIWIANTGQGTVSKVDTRTFVEVARYVTGPAGAGNDPSRTSVNTLGDAYVGNRGGRTVTKISVLGAECPDTNGDGMITTSTGPTDVLGWGMDDCVLWNTSLPDGGIIRGVAAQDVPGPDFTLHPYVWIGGWEGILWKLDGETGAIVLRTPSPTNNYGLALDGSGNLWISGRSTLALGRVDTNRCVDEASCSAPPCGADGDTCVKQIIPIPGGANPYGITVDVAQRVWLALYDTASVSRYDPAAPLASRWNIVSVGSNCHGIAADGEGWVWAACWATGIIRLTGDDPSSYTVVAGTGGFSCKGMAVDMDGKIWSINNAHNSAIVVTPGPTLTDASAMTGVVPTIISPYTYSDMTGQQLRLATDPRGYYRRVFEGCPDDGTNAGTEWRELVWDGDTPPGTSLLWRVRTAATRADLAAATWLLVATVPPATSPVDLITALGAAGVVPQRFLEIEVQLHSERASPTETITPRVRSLTVTHGCIPSIV